LALKSEAIDGKQGHRNTQIFSFLCLSPYFCANAGGFYSLVQTQGVSNRQNDSKVARFRHHRRIALDLSLKGALR
jgi:hypothetical protein